MNVYLYESRNMALQQLKSKHNEFSELFELFIQF